VNRQTNVLVGLFGHVDLMGMSAKVTKDRKTYAVVDFPLLGRALGVLDFVLLCHCESMIVESERRLSIY
jgi:hypothetical protein